MNEVSCIRSKTKLEIGKELRKSIGPCSLEHRFMLAPEDSRRVADRRQRRRRSLDDGHSARMDAQIPVESALKISGFHEVVHPDFEFVVKCVLAVRPMAQEAMNVDAACVARRTDQIGD